MNKFKVTVAGECRRGINPSTGEEWKAQDVVLVETDAADQGHPNTLAVTVWDNDQPLASGQTVTGMLSFSARSYKDKNGNTRYSTNVKFNIDKPF